MGGPRIRRRCAIWLALAAIGVGVAAPLDEPFDVTDVGLASQQLELFPQAPVDPVDPLGAQVQAGVVQISTELSYENAVGSGTGIVLSPGGEALTNNHVVSGATSITATSVGNGRSYPVEVLGYDRHHDIALVRLVGATDLPTARLGDSSQLTVGQAIFTLGNAGGVGSPLNHDTGKITSLNETVVANDDLTGSSEELSGLIGIAADLRPGDSGGPLVNDGGQVVGVNAAAAVNYRLGTPAGHGYAIPINQALSIAQQIRSGASSASVHVGDTAQLGVGVVSGRRPSGNGISVRQVLRGGPADQAGIAPGDTLTAFDGRPLESATTLTDMLDQHHPGDTVTLAWVDASGNPRSAPVVLGKGSAG